MNLSGEVLQVLAKVVAVEVVATGGVTVDADEVDELVVEGVEFGVPALSTRISSAEVPGVHQHEFPVADRIFTGSVPLPWT